MKIINSLYKYDLRLLLWCSYSPYRLLRASYAKAISKTGDGYLQVLIPALLLLFDQQHGQRFFISVALGFLLQLPVYWLLKNSLKRKRPPQAIPSFQSSIIASDEFSFPSGHTSAAFLLANLSMLFYGAVVWPLYLWASLVGLSRVVLGVHFPSDIMAGICLACITTVTVATILG